MTLAERVLLRAQGQLGVREATGRNDGEPSERYMGGRREPWCSWFCLWLFREEGAPFPGDWPPDGRENALASALHLESMCREQGWLVSAPMPGDLIFLHERGASDQGPGHHVGLVSKVALTAIETINGNWGNAVALQSYRRAGLDALVSAYGRVPEP